MSTHSEQILRDHITNILDEYVLTHLTEGVDHKESQDRHVVQLLLQELNKIPISDHGFLRPPTEPLQDLWDRHGIAGNTTEYIDEEFTQPREVFEEIHSALKFKGHPKTSTCWDDDAAFELRDEFTAFEPRSSIITLKAMRSTPKFGAVANTDPRPRSQVDAVSLAKPLALTSEEYNLSSIVLDEVLDIQSQVDAETLDILRKSIQNNPFMNCAPVDSTLSPAVQSLYHDSHRILSLPREMTPPIFPRNVAAGTTSMPAQIAHPTLTSELAELSSIFPIIDIKEEDMDMEAEHLAIVDGWQTFRQVSSPSTPSLGDGTSDIDELFLPSPDPEPLSVTRLFMSELEPTIFPRTRCVGSSSKRPADLGAGQSLASFLHPVISADTKPTIVATTKSSARPSPDHVQTSIIGQPPTTLDTPAASSQNMPSDDDDFKVMLERVHGGIGETELDLILREQPDIKKHGLMDVPDLPPPTIEEARKPVPRSMAELVFAPSKLPPHANLDCASPFGFIKKHRLNALNLELSWSVTKYKMKSPILDNLSHIEALAHHDDPDEHEQEVSQELLKNVVSIFETPRPLSSLDLLKSRSIALEGLLHTFPSLEGSWDTSERILTRDERRRLRQLHCDQPLLEDDIYSDEDQDALYTHIVPTGWDNANSSAEDHLASKSPDARYHGPETRPPLFLPTPADVPVTDNINQIPNCPKDFPDADGYRNLHTYTPHLTPDEMQMAEDIGTYSWPMDDQNFDVLPETFRPLSLDSTQLSQIPSHPHPRSHPPQDVPYFPFSSPLPGSSIPETSDSSVYPPDQNMLSSCSIEVAIAHLNPLLPPPPASEHVFVRQSLTDFILARGHALPVEETPEDVPEEDAFVVGKSSKPPQKRHIIPQEVVDKNTLVMPAASPQPTTIHRYLASLDLIQKRALVMHLCSQSCCVDLVERDTLSGVDLILDADSAVLYFPLTSLPTQCDALKLCLDGLSWRYRNLLLVFESFPTSRAYVAEHTDDDVGIPNMFSPPVLKAIKKLRRDLGISDACDLKRENTDIVFAFARSVFEAAIFVRLFGNRVERRSGTVWGSRDWLGEEVNEAQQDLAGADGMNHYAAAAIMSHVSMDDFLNMSAQERLHYFASVVGEDRVILLNELIGRLAAPTSS